LSDERQRFSRSFRTLEAEPEGRSRVAMFAAVVVLVAWATWFARAHLTVYATSTAARVEVTRATHPVDVPVAGRVVSVNVRLDQVATEGDVLAQLDDQVEQLQLAEARARAEGLVPQVDATRVEIAAEERALGDLSNTQNAAIAGATARIQEATVAAALAKDEAARADKLHTSGSVSDVEAIRARADSDQKAASQAAALSDVMKLQHQYRTDHDDRRTRLASLALDAAKLEADLANVKATIATLEHDIARRRVLAPASGRIGEIGNVQPGSVVKEGERIATIVSTGELRVIAQYAPADALGLVHAGQMARVRLEGFPWTEYGEVKARVTDVARELRDGHARVELEVVQASPRIPLQHGMPGTVQIELEQATPMELVLRAAGHLVAGTHAVPAASSSAGAAPTGG
jgi:membrane fusion protein (multidrug efflux system)